jgi:hypothetical protein
MRPGTSLAAGALLAATVLALPAFAVERELDEAPPSSSAREIQTPIEKVFPEEVERAPLFPWLRSQLQHLPPFFRDTVLDVRYRTYYLRQDRSIDVISEAWAMGGSLAYRSGWLLDTFRVELEGFTSQPIVAEDKKSGTLMLQPVQDGIAVLGIANARLRYKGIVLSGYRQYLDLPFLNRHDSRMIPNTFESLVLEKPEGELTFSAGYTWKVKLRDSDEFESLTHALGVTQDRGLAHAGVFWNPNENLYLGFVGGGMDDVLATVYAEASVAHDFAEGWEARLDAQVTGRGDIGQDFGEGLVEDTWGLGLRASASYQGAVARLGFAITGDSGPITSIYGSNPSYTNLMQRTFTRQDEKALLASLSYDFSGLGLEGLSAIVNFVAAFDGVSSGEPRDAQEIDVTLDYRIGRGWLQSFWLRLRGSWLHEQGREQDGTDFRVILRYDVPVI